MFLAGCVSNDLQQVKKIKSNDKIIVVSKFGNALPVKTVGLTAFQNEYFELDIKGWKVNKYIEHRITEKLNKNYISISNRVIRDNIKTPKNDFLTGYPSPITNKAALVEAQKLNANYILVISPISFPDVYFGTNQQIVGNGLYQRSGNVIQYAQMSFNLFDAKTGGFIATNGTIGHKGGDSVWITNIGLGRNIFNSEADFPEVQLNKIKSNNEDLIDTLVDRSLDFMQFRVE